MPGWLQKLRDKSPQTRHRIALGTSISVTCLIFVMWVTVLNFGGGAEVDSLQAGNPEASQTASPLSAFSNNAASAFRQLKGGFLPSGEESQQSNDDEDFWVDTQSRPIVSGDQDKELATSTEGEDESFTSRNYNPNQESNWFSQ